MRAVASIAFCLACLSASGADADNPYVGIVDRNVFQLRPPVLVPPVTNPQPPAVVSKLTLTGITTIFGKPLALLTTQPTGKPQDAGKREHYSLRVGQRMDGIEVLSIDAKKGVVRVKNNGAEETLDFINNGAKLVAAAAPPAGGGVPNPNVPALAQAGGRSYSPPATRTVQTRTAQRYQSGPTVGQNPATQLGAGGGYIVQQPATPNNAVRRTTPLSREEQAAMIELQRIHLQEQGRHDEANLFPVTGFQPGGTTPPAQ